MKWYRCQKCAEEYGDAESIPCEFRACLMYECNGTVEEVGLDGPDGLTTVYYPGREPKTCAGTLCAQPYGHAGDHDS